MTLGDVVGVSGRAMLVVAAHLVIARLVASSSFCSILTASLPTQAALGMLSRGIGGPLSHPSLKSFERVFLSSCRFLLFSRILHYSALSGLFGRELPITIRAAGSRERDPSHSR